MADTTFVSKVTIIATAWAQDLNNVAYRILGTGGNVPTTVSQLLSNLGLSTTGSAVLKGDGAGLYTNSKVALTEPATAATLTIANNKTLTCSNNITLAGTDGSTTGTAAFLNVGTGANQVVQMDSGAKLPAVDGSQLTNLPGTLPTGFSNDFRLSLQTGTPYPTGNQVGATVIYCTPAIGNKISLYSGGGWVTRSSAEFSLALGTLTASLPYDVFCYDNGGVPTLEFLAWTSATARATALTTQDGVYVKNGDATRKYLGSFYTTSTTTTESSRQKRLLWNYYIRNNNPMEWTETTSTWTFSTDTAQYANNNSANVLSIMSGLAVDAIYAEAHHTVSTNTGTIHQVFTGVGLDSASFYNEGTIKIAVRGITQDIFGRVCLTASGAMKAQLGFHTITWIEQTDNTGDTRTWYNDQGAGIRAMYRC